MTTITAAEFRVGAVLSRGFQVLFRNLIPFGAVCLIVTAPSYVYALLVGGAQAQEATVGQIGPADIAVIIGAVVLYLLLTLAATAALVYGTVQELRGWTIAMGACIGRGLALMLPALGVAILGLLIIAVGSVIWSLLVFAVVGASQLVTVLVTIVWVPVVATMLWVAIPAAVVERPGVLASLKRSVALTRGCRWKILAIIIAVILLQTALGFVISALVGLLPQSPGSQAPPALIGVDWVLQAFSTALWAVMSAVSYHDLRVAKEGLDTERIAAVFD